MPLLDLDTLNELYPDREGRRDFLQRAKDILGADRRALQDALARHAYEESHHLAHRLQGTASFLTGEPEHSAAIFAPLGDVLAQRRLTDTGTHAAQAKVLDHLAELEKALQEQLAADCA
ncbi:hypothetical protein [Bordetella flabilis]|uniref:hypothetical protein n=1 Tax=Bordetella flabilis TaxID=463014 RepID=UPI000AD35AF0|nr:hypothetical protein [Bordetella flabilis]